MKLPKWMMIVLTLLIIFEWAKPTTLFSSYENRYLQQRPKWNVQDVLSGKYQRDYENFVNDQFVFRNGWVRLKTFSYAIMQKTEYKNIVRGDHDFLFNKQFKIGDRFQDNQAFLKTFLDQHPNSIGWIAMNSYEVHQSYLRHHFLWINQKDFIKSIQHEQLMDPCLIMNEPMGDLYYKSDHHWNLKGAYFAASQILHLMGYEIKDYEAYPIQQKEGFLGSYYKQMLPLFYPSETFYYLDSKVQYTVNNHTYDHLFNQDALKSGNYYDGFLYGNHGFSRIENQNDLKKILIIKDSYANSMIPFMTDYFRQIDIVDLRHFNGSMKDLIEKEAYDHILFLENFDQFQENRHIFKLNM